MKSVFSGIRSIYCNNYMYCFFLLSVFCLFQLISTNNYFDNNSDVEVGVVVEAFSLLYPGISQRTSGGDRHSKGLLFNTIVDNDDADAIHRDVPAIAPPPPLHDEWSDERKNEFVSFFTS